MLNNPSYKAFINLLRQGQFDLAETIRTEWISTDEMYPHTELYQGLLHTAVRLGLEDVAQKLLSPKQAIKQDIEEQDMEGWRPLHWAVYNKDFEMVYLLFRFGADINARTLEMPDSGLGWEHEDQTPYIMARALKNNKMAAFLAILGADTDLEQSKTAFSVDFEEDDDIEIDKLLEETEWLREIVEEIYKSRLLLGEADLSYVRALIAKQSKKHPLLPYAITATEFNSKRKLQSLYPDSFEQNFLQIKRAGVDVRFEVDAEKLTENTEIKQKRYQRIHFNFPHNGLSYETRTLPKLIANFFQKAAKLQQVGDRIHMGLPKGKDERTRLFYEAYAYELWEASTGAGYVPVKQRKFAERYPGYVHRQTKKNISAPVSDSSRELIFEKYDMVPSKLKEMFPPKQFYRNNKKYNYYEDPLQTSSDSSTYCLDEQSYSFSAMQTESPRNLDIEMTPLSPKPNNLLSNDNCNNLNIQTTETVTKLSHSLVRFKFSESDDMELQQEEIPTL